MMKTLLLAAAALGGMVMASATAEARQGCGPGFHRGYYGRCVSNRGPHYAPRAYIVHRYYPGRGYWYGNRFWGHRHRWHGGWRYR